jgi:Domain of unknown function (DUF4129)
MNCFHQIPAQGVRIQGSPGQNPFTRQSPVRSVYHSLKLMPAIIGVALLLPTAVCTASDAGNGLRERLNLPREPEPVLAEILARDEFKDADPWWKFLDEIKDWLWNAFLDFLEKIFGAIPNTGPLTPDRDIWWTILTAMLIGIVLLAVLSALKPLFTLLGGRRRKDPVGQTWGPGGQSPPRGSGLFWDRSQELADAGTYGAALVNLFLFSLTRLDELGRLSYKTGRTNREILESISEEGALKEILAEMVPIFNRVRYGDAPCGKSDFEHFLSLCGRAVERS